VPDLLVPALPHGAHAAFLAIWVIIGSCAGISNGLNQANEQVRVANAWTLIESRKKTDVARS
jgi:hypothetical protein